MGSDSVRSKSASSDNDTVLSNRDVSKEVEPSQVGRLNLDSGNEEVRTRGHFWEFWIPQDPPAPPPSNLWSAEETPLAKASIFSILWFSWITPIMTLGYQRTLQASDLWKLDENRTSAVLADNFEKALAKRFEDAEKWNKGILNGTIHPSVFRRAVWFFRSLASLTHFSDAYASLESDWRREGGQKSPNVALALNDTLGRFFWIGGLFKVIADTAQLMCPLLVKQIIYFAQERERAKQAGLPKPNIGRGIALAIGLFLLTVFFSITQNQFFWRSMISGAMARATLVSSMYKRSVKLTGKARTTLSNSDIVNHISTDVSRVDICCHWFHASWTAPIQISVCLIILLVQLGPSALAGFALFLLIGPIQQQVMAFQFRTRQTSMKSTEHRAKTLLEALGSMRIVKYFTYETSFLNRISEVRKTELKSVRTILNAESGNFALAHSVPYLAATLAFITYTQVKKEFDAAVIFASLALFQLLRQPMMFLPRGLSAIADARSAFARLDKVFHAELMREDPIVVNEAQEWGLLVENATFEWEEALLKDDSGELREKSADTPFQLRDVNMRVARGSLVGIVGRVGSGKSSLLQAIIGEMRKLSGEVSFGGRTAYCPQTAWIQNASLRSNIIFGQPFEEERYWQAVESACLLPDLQLLADGDLTEIGEKGINLSGGQKQRINIARALYFDADVIILDDPLSAVDAHVGKSLFHSAILALAKRGKTVLFVTHALHFLSFCDYIYTLDSGRIAEQGTYQALITAKGEFARLDEEFGGNDPGSLAAKGSQSVVLEEVQSKSSELRKRYPGKGTLEGKLIVKEARHTGTIANNVWLSYLSAGRGFITIPILVLAGILMQGAQIVGSYTLVWWQTNFFDRPFSFYQMLYAVLGITQAICSLGLGVSVDIISYLVSRNLHQLSIHNIFHAPMSFFDTTPLGRILGVFGKDIDIIDNQLPVSMRMLILTVSGVAGSIITISVVEPYFIIVAFFMGIGYVLFSSFYRASAREIKRIDSMLRSLMYSHLSESLTGLSTLRSYGQVSRFVRDNEFFTDLENRAIFLASTNQRWLTVRLDICGALLVFFVAFFAVIDVSKINPAQVGLILTFTTSLIQTCAMVTRQVAEVENYMNAVERVSHYSDQTVISQEAAHEKPETKPGPQWPESGAIEFKDVSMKYRPGLPNVLHSISMSIKGGEKIGVVGRTGAGKSSLVMTLMRIVEYSGTVLIDGVDISTLGLKDLRSKISIIPQDPTVFSGTVRTALDPFSLYDDARLWDALRRSFLVGSDSQGADSEKIDDEGGVNVSRITLDTVLEAEGLNLSVGERSLLSLARALVKDTKVVVLDEATASVDLETDKKIQQTIQTQFVGQTLICIAHRLRTILGYDRILVLDSGNIAEFDTPLSLFHQDNGIFRSLCLRSNITEKEIMSSKID